jgi:predicted Zn-dependent protease with MMP-like domain
MSPEEFPEERFRALVDEAIQSLPRRFRDAMVNMAIVVEDEPTLDQLQQVEVEPPDTLYGLYEGIPLPERQWAHGNVLPDKISIFRLPILEDSADEDDIVVGIGETLIHEVGHYFGLSEEEIMEIEDNYWRGEAQD